MVFEVVGIEHVEEMHFLHGEDGRLIPAELVERPRVKRMDDGLIIYRDVELEVVEL